MENKEVIKLVSVLLQYPERELFDASLSELLDEIQSTEIKERMTPFIDYLLSLPYEELVEQYVRTFDFSEKTNLYLTYSKLKEERERGQLLVKLKRIYEDEGFIFDTDELPDYLPLFLEFVSIAKEETLQELIPQIKTPITELKRELEMIESPYKYLIDTCLVSLDGLTIS